MASALSFTADNATHTHSLRLVRSQLRHRERQLALYLFNPRGAQRSEPALALISGGALTRRQTSTRSGRT